MENKRTSLFREIINFLKNIKNSEIDEKVDYEKDLTSEEKAELEAIRKEDKVENIRAKYSAAVDTGVAKAKAQKSKIEKIRPEKIKE